MKLEQFAELYNFADYGITTEKQKELLEIALRTRANTRVGRPRAAEFVAKDVELIPEQVKLFFDLAVERCAIFVRKELGGAYPDGTLTTNPILQTYRFCNVFRDYDKFSRVLHTNDLPLVVQFILRWTCCQVALDKIVARKSRDTLLQEALAQAENGNAEPFVQWLLEEHKYGMPLTGISYLVLHSDDDEMLLRNRAEWGYKLHALLDNAAPQSQSLEQLTNEMVEGMPQVGAFLAGCLLTDWALYKPELFTDSYTWVAFGPGAVRGAKGMTESKEHPLNVALKLLKTWQGNNAAMLSELEMKLQVKLTDVDAELVSRGLVPITKRISEPTLLDVEHWLCEIDKYKRIEGGEVPNGRRVYA